MSGTVVDEVWDAANYAGRFFVDFLIFIAGLLVFVAIIGVTIWLGGWARRWLLQRAEARLPDDGNLPSIVDNVFRLAIFVAGLVLALGVVGASTDSLVTWIGIIVAALSIAMQDIIKNLVAGFYLLFERRFGAGDRIVVAGEAGIVERVDLRVTAIRNRQRQLVLVPNYLVFSQMVTTRTARDHDCLVLNISNIEGSPEVVRQVFQVVIGEALGPGAQAPDFNLMAIQAGSVTVTARVFLDERQAMREQVILAIHDRFPSAEITVVDG